jgi:hypothetical protein
MKTSSELQAPAASPRKKRANFNHRIAGWVGSRAMTGIVS